MPLEWRQVRRSKKIEYASGVKIVGQESSAGERKQSMKEEEEMKQQPRMKVIRIRQGKSEQRREWMHTAVGASVK